MLHNDCCAQSRIVYVYLLIISQGCIWHPYVTNSKKHVLAKPNLDLKKCVVLYIAKKYIALCQI